MKRIVEASGVSWRTEPPYPCYGKCFASISYQQSICVYSNHCDGNEISSWWYTSENAEFCDFQQGFYNIENDDCKIFKANAFKYFSQNV